MVDADTALNARRGPGSPSDPSRKAADERGKWSRAIWSRSGGTAAPPPGRLRVAAFLVLGILLVALPSSPTGHAAPRRDIPRGTELLPTSDGAPTITLTSGFAGASHAVSAPLYLEVDWNFAAYPVPGFASFTVSVCHDYRNSGSTLTSYGFPVTAAQRSTNLTDRYCLVAPSPSFRPVFVVVTLALNATPSQLVRANLTLAPGTTTGAPAPVLPAAAAATIGPLSLVGIGWETYPNNRHAYVPGVTWLDGDTYANFSWAALPAGSGSIVLDVYEASCSQVQFGAAGIFGIPPNATVGIAPSQTWVNLTRIESASGQWVATGLWSPLPMEVYCAVLSATGTNGSVRSSNAVQFATPYGQGAGATFPAGTDIACQAGANVPTYPCVSAWGNVSVVASGYSVGPANGTRWGWATVNLSYLRTGSPTRFDTATGPYPQNLSLFAGAGCLYPEGVVQALLYWGGEPPTLTLPFLRYPTAPLPAGGQAWSFYITANYTGNPGFDSACVTVYTPLAPLSTGGGFVVDPSQAVRQAAAVAVEFWPLELAAAAVAGGAAAIAHTRDRRLGSTRS